MKTRDTSTSTDGAVLRLSGVSFVRAGNEILSRVDWKIHPGERWVVLGPNGSGKTTLLRIASTYETASRGRVEVLSNLIGEVDVRELRRDIGYMSQPLSRAVPGGTTALDLVVMGRDATLRRFHQVYEPEDVDRARQLLEMVGCTPLADHRYATLSEGERQRVQIARSLMAHPHLLLLDEPTAGLDLAGRELLLETLSQLAHQPEVTPGIVLVTHHVEEIPDGFTHALLLREGRVVAAGSLADTLTDEALSGCFGVPLRLREVDGRFFATARGERAAVGTHTHS